MTKIDSTGKAMVSSASEWIPVSKTTPIGVKVLVIDEKQGIAYLRPYWPKDGWTHWYPLPKFPKGRTTLSPGSSLSLDSDE